MAHDTVNYLERIVQSADSTVNGAVIRGTRIPVKTVLAELAATLDIDALFRDHPELTPDDIRAVLTYARDRVHDAQSESPASAISPQDFYAELTNRPDVSELMRRLAR
jgi:uncharacterized protein (DUF433 family)